MSRSPGVGGRGWEPRLRHSDRRALFLCPVSSETSPAGGPGFTSRDVSLSLGSSCSSNGTFHRRMMRRTIGHCTSGCTGSDTSMSARNCLEHNMRAVDDAPDQRAISAATILFGGSGGAPSVTVPTSASRNARSCCFSSGVKCKGRISGSRKG